MVLDKFRKRKKLIDYFLALIVFIFVAFGILMIFSASVAIAYEQYGNQYALVIRQLEALGIGLILLIVMTITDYRVWQKYATHLLAITIILLLVVFIPSLGLKHAGAYRWITLGFISFQPSEIIKLTFILYAAAWLTKKGEGIRNFSTGFVPFILILGLVILLIMAEPDMGTMSVIAASVTAIFFISGAPLAYVFLYIGGALTLFLTFIFSASYRMQRFLTFLNPDQSQINASYHIKQAYLAVGSGGWFGLGFGQSLQKYFLPEAPTDSIFAIACEELGFIGAGLIVLLFLALAWRGYRIALNAPDTFSRLVATGITTWIVWQAFINIGAMIGVIPLTGVPLPFISYGGTALIVNLAAVGILLNISRQAKI